MRRTDVRPMPRRRAISALANTGTIQLPNLDGPKARRHWPAELFTVLPGVRQARPRSFPQNLPFELGEDRQQAGHGAAGGRGQVQCLGQRDETDSEMLQFLKRRQQVCYRSAPAVEAPDQDDIDFAAARSLDQLLTGLPPHRSGANLTNLQGDRPAAPGNILPQSAYLHGQSLLIVSGDAGVQPRAKHFRGPASPGRKRYRILPFEKPVFWAFQDVT